MYSRCNPFGVLRYHQIFDFDDVLKAIEHLRIQDDHLPTPTVTYDPRDFALKGGSWLDRPHDFYTEFNQAYFLKYCKVSKETARFLLKEMEPTLHLYYKKSKDGKIISLGE